MRTGRKLNSKREDSKAQLALRRATAWALSPPGTPYGNTTPAPTEKKSA